jgi:hypothetical protein
MQSINIINNGLGSIPCRSFSYAYHLLLPLVRRLPFFYRIFPDPLHLTTGTSSPTIIFYDT